MTPQSRGKRRQRPVRASRISAVKVSVVGRCFVVVDIQLLTLVYGNNPVLSHLLFQRSHGLFEMNNRHTYAIAFRC